MRIRSEGKLYRSAKVCISHEWPPDFSPSTKINVSKQTHPMGRFDRSPCKTIDGLKGEPIGLFTSNLHVNWVKLSSTPTRPFLRPLKIRNVKIFSVLVLSNDRHTKLCVRV